MRTTNVTTPPFGPDTYAYRAPHGVRLFHAAVRHMLRNDPTYDRAALGEPINQEDLLGTLLAFTVVVIDVARTVRRRGDG